MVHIKYLWWLPAEEWFVDNGYKGLVDLLSIKGNWITIPVMSYSIMLLMLYLKGKRKVNIDSFHIIIISLGIFPFFYILLKDTVFFIDIVKSDNILYSAIAFYMLFGLNVAVMLFASVINVFIVFLIEKNSKTYLEKKWLFSLFILSTLQITGSYWLYHLNNADL